MTTGPGGLSHEQLRALYVDKNLSKKAMVRALGCSDTTVAAALRHFGLTRAEQPKITDAQRHQIIDMYTRERLSARTISEHTSVSRDMILQTLRAANVPLRGRGARIADQLDADELRHRYEAGASLRQLAQAARTDDGKIKDALLVADVAIRRQGRIAQWQDVLTLDFLQRAYVDEQQSLAQTARQVGCSYQTVLLAAHRHDLALRTRRRPARRD